MTNISTAVSTEEFMRQAARRLQTALPAEYDVKVNKTSVTVYSSVDKAAKIADRIRRAGFRTGERCAPNRRVQWVKIIR